MRLLIFGGTTEGRELAMYLSPQHQVTVSVATSMGEEELQGIPGIQVVCGRRNPEQIQQLVKDFDWCIDATHPYATQATRDIEEACQKAGVPLRRLSRPASERTGDCLRVPECSHAAALLAGREGNVLVATGAKELRSFSLIPTERLYVRVLPTHKSLEACEALGLPHGHIIAMQGPFTQKLNEALMEQYQIRWLVTKDGGDAGGFQEKRDAAKAVGASLVLVERPQDSGSSMEDVLREAEGLK